MKIVILIAVIVLSGFTSQQIFGEIEMTGHLKVMDVYSTEQVTESYIFWFQEVDQPTIYKLNPNTLPQNVLDMAGEKVRIVVEEPSFDLVTHGETQQQFLNVISIQKIEIPEGILGMMSPTTWRSVTLLNYFNGNTTTPTEDPFSFANPQGIDLDASSNLFVADSGPLVSDHSIKKLNSGGFLLEEFGNACLLNTVGQPGCGDPDGAGPLELGDGQFAFPSDIAIDSFGNMIVADNNNNRIQKIDSSGTFLFKVGAFGGNGTLGNGDGEFQFPYGIATDSANNIYVTDQFNGRVEKFDSDGNFQGWLGACNSGPSCNLGNFTSMGFSCNESDCSDPINTSGNGQFSNPRGIAIDSSDKIYVADQGNHRIQIFDSSGNYLGKFGIFGSENGKFNSPRGVAVDDSKIYVADTGNDRIQVFNSTGSFQLVFGTSGSGDGQFDFPQGIDVDSSGNIFVGDTNNDRIQKFNSTGSFISKIDTSAGQSHDTSYYQALFYDGEISVNQYFNASSYGKFTLNGTVNGWNTVSSSQGALVGNFEQMLTEAIAAHDADVDFCNPTPVTNLILVFNGPVNTIADSAFGSINSWGGARSFEGGGCMVAVSVVWNPDNGGFFCCGQRLDRGIGVTAHEIGHNLGFLHTPLPPGDWRNEFNPIATDPYHDTYSLMSTNRDQESPSALITAQRNDAGWMEAGNKATVSDGTSATITLDFINEPEGGINPQMITVPLQDGTSYIIEAHKDEVFNDTPQDRTGAVMYKHFPSGVQYAYLSPMAEKDAKYSLVATAGTNTTAQIDQAILELSETYEDNINSVTVTTQSVGATSITVFVSNNAGSCTPPAGADWVITESCAVTQNVTADKNITVDNNSVLTIPNGFTVFFDPATFKITVKAGSGILIEQGGSIKTTP